MNSEEIEGPCSIQKQPWNHPLSACKKFFKSTRIFLTQDQYNLDYTALACLISDLKLDFPYYEKFSWCSI